MRLELTGGVPEGEVPHTPYKEESDSEEEEEEIAAVEMILETYFMHCDNTYNKLQTLCESSKESAIGNRHQNSKPSYQWLLERFLLPYFRLLKALYICTQLDFLTTLHRSA